MEGELILRLQKQNMKKILHNRSFDTAADERKLASRWSHFEEQSVKKNRLEKLQYLIKKDHLYIHVDISVLVLLFVVGQPH